MNEITATIEVIVFTDEEPTIDVICSPLEDQGWVVNSAIIQSIERDEDLDDEKRSLAEEEVE